MCRMRQKMAKVYRTKKRAKSVYGTKKKGKLGKRVGHGTCCRLLSMLAPCGSDAW